MHPIWFVQWAWEKAWSSDGLLPLIEHNQGALSLFALVFALVVFNVENRRANQEAASAAKADADRRQESLDAEIRARTFALEAEARERQALHDLSAKERAAMRQGQLEAEDRARLLTQSQEIRAVDEYVDACIGLIRPVIDGLAGPKATYNVTPTKLRIGSTHTATADRNADALAELLRASPRDPELILATQHAMSMLRWFCRSNDVNEAPAVQEAVARYRREFQAIVDRFEARRAELAQRIRSTGPPSPPRCRRTARAAQ